MDYEKEYVNVKTFPLSSDYPLYSWIKDGKLREAIKTRKGLVDTVLADFELNKPPLIFFNAFEDILPVRCAIQRTVYGYWRCMVKIPDWHQHVSLGVSELNKKYVIHGGLSEPKIDGWISWSLDRDGDLNWNDIQTILNGKPEHISKCKYWTLGMATLLCENVAGQFLDTKMQTIDPFSEMGDHIADVMVCFVKSQRNPKIEPPQEYLPFPA